ncbi:MAG: extracellular solute-binding protein [Chloroflexi bacterium]|nr:extracellular solute-binding protein [Chloroflexota bacterium]MCY3937860.1 extracellular solute-binding protein [Chloroflexota bacterium]
MAASATAAAALAACGGSGDADSPEAEKLKEILAKSSTEAAETVETQSARPQASGPVVIGLPTGGFQGSRVAVQVEGVVAGIRREQGESANLEHALIAAQPQSGPQGLPDAIAAARDDGRQLDLIYISNSDELEALNDAGMLTAVQAAATSDPSFDTSNYYQSALDAASIDGQLMALPVWVRPTMLQYSPRPFESAGIEPPNDSWDWPTFVERTSRLTVPRADGGRSQYGVLIAPGATPSYMFMWQNGAEILSPDGKTSAVNSPEAVEAVQFMADLVLEHEVSPRLIVGDDEDLTIDFSDDGIVINGGLVAMLPRQVGGQFGFSIFRAIFAGGGRGGRMPRVNIQRGPANQQSPSAGTTPSANPIEVLESLPLGPMPRGEVAANPGEAGGMVGVLDGAADVTSAWSELRTLIDALEVQGLVPARRMSSEELTRIDSSLDINSAAALINATEASRVPAFPRSQQITAILNQAIDIPVLTGEMSPLDACNAAAKQIDDLLAA